MYKTKHNLKKKAMKGSSLTFLYRLSSLQDIKYTAIDSIQFVIDLNNLFRIRDNFLFLLSVRFICNKTHELWCHDIRIERKILTEKINHCNVNTHIK